jgi:hypothetical protein
MIDYPAGVPVEVCALFEKLALQLRSTGFEHYSARAIQHRIRWHFTIDKGNRDFKCNDHWTPPLSRWVMKNHPHMDGFFRIRRLRGNVINNTGNTWLEDYE